MTESKFDKQKLSGVINVLFWSLILSLFLVRDRGMLVWDMEYSLIFVYIFFTYLVLNGILYYLFGFAFLKLRWGKIIAYLLANLLVSISFVSNYIFVSIFGKQLGMEGLVMMVRGWQGGELGNFTAVMISIVLGLFFYLFVFFIFFRIINRFIHQSYIKNKYLILLIILIGALIIPLHISLLQKVENSWKMEKLKHKIPWQSITGFPEEKIRITGDKQEGQVFPELFLHPPELSEKVEIEASLDLKKHTKEFLHLDIKATNKKNILFMNVEGLRFDMLNEENSPNLYKFATQRGIHLKKHYTTGNNTPGSLIGMFTGLSPFFFEPMRENNVPNLALEILKKLGYKQSIYYNSPKNYEYIYPDFLAGTEGSFIQIPGRYEDYAPRERKLIDTYIKDLQEDKDGKPRFDYYLVNVTHFNYYYPKEFEVYKPAFTMDYEIISGRQKKFEKHKEALMNRYKNSILYFDYLFKHLIDHLEEMGKLDETIIVVAGDHGEEFWEHGSFGHTWGLNNKQIQTAAVLYAPGLKTGDVQYKYTSHSDFLPTVFDIIGLNIDTNIFMTGKSLLRYDESKDYAISSLGVLVSFKRNDYAIIGNGLKILFKNNKNLNESPYAIYDDEDNSIPSIDPYPTGNLLRKIPESKKLKINEEWNVR